LRANSRGAGIGNLFSPNRENNRPNRETTGGEFDDRMIDGPSVYDMFLPRLGSPLSPGKGVTNNSPIGSVDLTARMGLPGASAYRVGAGDAVRGHSQIDRGSLHGNVSKNVSSGKSVRLSCRAYFAGTG